MGGGVGLEPVAPSTNRLSAIRTETVEKNTSAYKATVGAINAAVTGNQIARVNPNVCWVCVSPGSARTTKIAVRMGAVSTKCAFKYCSKWTRHPNKSIHDWRSLGLCVRFNLI